MAIHDSARPLVKEDDVRKCFMDALEVRPFPALQNLCTCHLKNEQCTLPEDLSHLCR